MISLNITTSREDFALQVKCTLNKGDFITILGHNGSGKTTLLKHINGLLIPKKGKVTIDGLDVKNLEAKKKIGMLFQNPDDQLISSIVEDDIAFGLENLALPTKTIQEKTKQIQKKLGISHLAKKNVNSLSFGQKQLVALAGILVMEPEYLLLDEPTTFLDVPNKKNIEKILESLHKEGKTIVMVSNNPADIALATNTIILRKGKVFFKGKATNQILKKGGLV